MAVAAPMAEKSKSAAHLRVYAWFSALITEDTDLLADLHFHGVPIDVLHPLRHSTALMEATRLGRVSLVQWLLDHGAAPVFLSGQPLGTPLHCALRRRHWPIARLLVERMDSCAPIDAYGATPLHTLTAEMFCPQEMEMVRPLALALIAKGCPLDALDQEGATALHHCAINDSIELADILLCHGANPNAVVPDSQVSALTIAALEQNSNMAHVLLFHGADPHLKTRDGVTACTLYPALAQLCTHASAEHASSVG